MYTSWLNWNHEKYEDGSFCEPSIHYKRAGWKYDNEDHGEDDVADDEDYDDHENGRFFVAVIINPQNKAEYHIW